MTLYLADDNNLGGLLGAEQLTISFIADSHIEIKTEPKLKTATGTGEEPFARMTAKSLRKFSSD